VTITAVSQANTAVSGSLTEAVLNPIPTLNSATVTGVSPNYTLTFIGTDFVSGAQVGLQGNLLPTTFVREAMPGFLERRPPGADTTFELCVRPEDLHIGADPRGEAVIEDITFLGNLARAALNWRGRRLIAELPGHCTLSPGEAVIVDAARGAWVCA